MKRMLTVSSKWGGKRSKIEAYTFQEEVKRVEKKLNALMFYDSDEK